MKDRIKIAVVDATHEDDGGSSPRQWPSRYVSSVANLPLLAQVVRSLAEDGIERVHVVTPATMCDRLESALRIGGDWGVRLSFHPSDNGEPLVSRLRQAVEDRPVLVHAGDCLFPGELPRLRAAFCARELELAVLTSGAPAACEDARHDLLLPREEPEGTAFVLGADAWAELERTADERLVVRELAERLRAAGRRVGCAPVRRAWCYRRSTECLLAGNQMLLDGLPDGAVPAGATEDCVIEGRVAGSQTARIARSRVRGPVTIGAGAVVEDSFIGPYTAIGAGAVVVGAEIEYSMVLADAQVRYPRYPLEASVIGERAVVAQSFELPAGLHLELGPDARVLLG
jgi:glucose-1-phosphate thymidylyltransferase